MKGKIKAFIGSILLAAILFASVVSAAGNRFSWYCAHAKDHLRPVRGAEFSCLEDHRAVYLGADEKVVYLTFDAGYENGNVEKVLDVLKEKEVTATFFILGHLIADRPDLVARMADEGHLVANHTYHHKDCSRLSESEFREELTSLEESYRKTTGRELAKFYRPPEGRFTEETLRYADALGYTTVFWSFGYADWNNEKQPAPAAATEKILSNVHPGEIMLLHPTSATNAEILGDVIDRIRADGYRFGSLDELTKETP